MIWVNTNGYTLSYPVYYIGNDNSTDTLIDLIPLDKMSQALCDYCYQYDTNDVLLLGNEGQLEEIKNDINKYNSLNYSENKRIEVHINEISS